MRLPAFLRRFHSREEVERAIDEALWLSEASAGAVREAFPIVAAADSSFVVFLAHGVAYRAVPHRRLTQPWSALAS